MLRNYFKIAIRNLYRNKGFSAVNIAGLAIGMASALLILLWIQNQLTYDRWYTKTDRLYKIYSRDKIEGKPYAWENTSSLLAPVVKKDLAAVEDVARWRSITFLASVGETHISNQGAFADSSFLRLFDFPVVKGDAAHALDEPKDIVLTQHMAIALFGDKDPIGKAVRIDSNADFTVTAVLKDPPPNTSFNFNYLLPWSFRQKLGEDDTDWGNSSVLTFALLKPGATQTGFDDQIRNIVVDRSDRKETTQLFSQPVNRLYLYSRSENGQLVGDRIKVVQLFMIIAGFILLIACINFMNLSTARSERRAREVGIRKVVGAVKSSLVAQFIGESILIAVLSFGLALFITQFALDPFNQLINTQLTIDYGNPRWWAFAIGFVLFSGLLAGSYPAFYLSSFQPVKVLKGTHGFRTYPSRAKGTNESERGTKFGEVLSVSKQLGRSSFRKVNALVSSRKALVVLQFTFAIALIICTLVIRRQIEYAQNRDAGYDRHNLVYTFTQGDIPQHYLAIRNDLLGSGVATSVSESYSPITRHWSDGWGYTWDGAGEEGKRIDFTYLGSDADFVKTMGASLIAGRDIDVYNYPTDTMALLLNETAVKLMGVKDPIGLNIRRDGQTMHVVGVIKDFILESPFTKIGPMMIQGPKQFFQIIHIKLNPARPLTADISKTQQILRRYNPRYPPQLVFADADYANKFQDEQQISKLAGLFAGLTIFISCLGLFALATYMAENRIREIGVRKVLGASVSGITFMLAKDFVWLVLAAFAIAAPFAWFAMRQWLGGYDYRTDIGIGVFALSGGLALLIAIATVSYQSIRAALSNPAKSLRTE
jgi:putative ABC transport system permease protein